MLKNIARIALLAWVIFLIFALSMSLVSSMRIYLVWLAISVIASVALIWAIQTQRGLAIVNAIAAGIFLGMHVLFWIVISSIIYGDASSSFVTRMENIWFVMLGNFSQGNILRGLQDAYMQILMPCIQIALLIATFVAANRRTQRASPQLP